MFYLLVNIQFSLLAYLFSMSYHEKVAFLEFNFETPYKGTCRCIRGAFSSFYDDTSWKQREKRHKTITQR